MGSFLRKFRCQKRRCGRNSNSSIVRWPRRAASGFQSHLPCRGEKIWNRTINAWRNVTSVWTSEICLEIGNVWSLFTSMDLIIWYMWFIIGLSSGHTSVPRSTPTGNQSWEWGRHRLHFEKMKTETEKLEQLGRLFGENTRCTQRKTCWKASMEANGNFGYRIYSLSRPSSGITCSPKKNTMVFGNLEQTISGSFWSFECGHWAV